MSFPGKQASSHEQVRASAPPRHLVVVGSSAGGIEALSILVEGLPAHFPAPVVLAQHLDPTRPSNLDQILQHHTALSVESVTTTCVLQEGHIYIVPANCHVIIHDHHIEAREEHVKRPQPSIDELLSTAAQAYGENLIAVILTGTGSDGMLGSIDVKNAGGLVVIQNPQTARYPSMPLSLPPSIIDHSLDVEQIGPLLDKLLMLTSIPQTEERPEDTLQEILTLVNQQAHIDFHPYKTSTILRRISRRMAITHKLTMQDYTQYVKTHPEEVGELVKALLINVTQFFRDPEAFTYLESDILPKLIEQARARDRVLRFWAAGCATGEEPYSLAMVLATLLEAELSKWSIKIFATDLDEAAIDFARRGIYSEKLLAGVPQKYRDRFFERLDHQRYRICKTVRQIVIFGQQDLGRSASFPRIDLILCRNVLIYFTPQLQEMVLNQFALSLHPNGYLFLGKAETVRPKQTLYKLVNKQWKVYQCTGKRLSPGELQPHFSKSTREHLRAHQSKIADMTQEGLVPGFESGQLLHSQDVFLRFLPTGVVVIDRSYRMILANRAARQLLGLQQLENDQDFLHAVPGLPYRETRTAIDTVFREREPINLAEVEIESTMGENRYVSLALALVQMEAGRADLVIICITDVTQIVQVRRQLETIQAQQTKLLNDLETSNKHLNNANKELLNVNEELQVSNE